MDFEWSEIQEELYRAIERLATDRYGSVPRGLVDAVPATIFSGTSDMQRNITRELGL